MFSWKYCFVAVLTVGLIAPTIAQNSTGFTIADLPACAQPCADNASGIVNCKLTDISCLCSSPEFAQATTTCATSGGVCNLSDQSTTLGILGAICPNQPDPTDPNGSVVPSTPIPGATSSSSASSSTSTSALIKGSSTTSSSQLSSASATSNTISTQSSSDKGNSPLATSTPTPAAANGGVTVPTAIVTTSGLVNGLANTDGASSTVVVVQTVVPSDSNSLPSAAGGSLGTGIKWSGAAAMVAGMAGALMLL